jgi:hypothetical protein
MKTTTRIAMAMYQPQEGKSAELKTILKEHIPTLQQLELITDRPTLSFESTNGTIIEVFEWLSDTAKDVAHKHPAVRMIWGKMSGICSFPSLKDLPEANHSFPNFIPL